MIKKLAIILLLGMFLVGCQKEDTSFEMKDSMRFKDTEENTQEPKFDFVNNQDNSVTSTEEKTEEKTEQQTTQQKTTEQKTDQPKTTEQSKKEEKKDNAENNSGKDTKTEGDKKTTEKSGKNADANGKKSDEGESAAGEGEGDVELTDVESPDVTIEVRDEEEIVE